MGTRLELHPYLLTRLTPVQARMIYLPTLEVVRAATRSALDEHMPNTLSTATAAALCSSVGGAVASVASSAVRPLAFSRPMSVVRGGRHSAKHTAHSTHCGPATTIAWTPATHVPVSRHHDGATPVAFRPRLCCAVL